MHKRHTDGNIIFKEQEYTVSKYIAPLIDSVKIISPSSRVMEIGFGVGGNMATYIQQGTKVVGVDFSSNKLKIAKKNYQDQIDSKQVVILESNIYDVSADNIGTFDLIFLKDTIEHIHDQNRFLAHIRHFLKPNGIIFISFPPIYMPMGGHQQLCKNRILSKLPYYHLLPDWLYKSMLRIGGETEQKIDSLLEIKSTGISIDRLRKLFDANAFKIEMERIYFINPNYEIKFNLRPVLQNQLIGKIPFFKSCLSTCAYYIVSKKL